VVIPNSLSRIGNYVFESCASLRSVAIPDSVTSIGVQAFDDCRSLASVTMGAGVSSIGDQAFEFCGLRSVTIPDSVASIGSSAFYNCGSLASVTIPGSVTNIGDQALALCSSLTGVYFQGNAPSLGSLVFDGDNKAVAYYLPGTAGWGAEFGGQAAVLWNAQVETSGGAFGVRSNQFGFTIGGASNLVVVVEAATNLANPCWYPLQTNTLGGGSFYFSDAQWTNYPGRFYRLRWP
jgi:hypothetical protein